MRRDNMRRRNAENFPESGKTSVISKMNEKASVPQTRGSENVKQPQERRNDPRSSDSLGATRTLGNSGVKSCRTRYSGAPSNWGCRAQL